MVSQDSTRAGIHLDDIDFELCFNKLIKTRILERTQTMTRRQSFELSSSQRAREHRKLLEQAQARPGIYEVMKVYHNWKETDRGMDSYRSATNPNYRITTTNTTT